MRDKIKSWMWAIVAAAAFVVVAMNPPKIAEAQTPFTSRIFSTGVGGQAVTDSNTPLAFTDNHSGGTSLAFVARGFSIRNDPASANSCFFDFLDTTATTADILLEPGASFSLTLPGNYSPSSGWAGVGLICDTAETATFHVVAYR